MTNAFLVGDGGVTIRVAIGGKVSDCGLGFTDVILNDKKVLGLVLHKHLYLNKIIY